MTLTAVALGAGTHELGEGPTWDATRRVAHWVDIDRGRVYEATFSSGFADRREVYTATETVGAAVHTRDGGLLVGKARSLARVDAAGTETAEVDVISAGIDSRLNDGGCDPAGRYLVGSLALDARVGQERLWRLEHTGRLVLIDDDLTISNGLGWSPDGASFYSIDSVPGTVWVRSYDPESGAVGRRHRLFGISDGTPDGLAVDVDGNLWIAVWGESQVRCYSCTGALLDVVATGAPLTTSCAFVGPDLRTLLITSARERPDRDSFAGNSGKLLAVDVPATGIAATAWTPSI